VTRQLSRSFIRCLLGEDNLNTTRLFAALHIAPCIRIARLQERHQGRRVVRLAGDFSDSVHVLALAISPRARDAVKKVGVRTTVVLLAAFHPVEKRLDGDAVGPGRRADGMPIFKHHSDVLLSAFSEF